MTIKSISLSALFLALIGSTSYTRAEVVTLIPDAGFPTGGNINALAGPLLASDIDSVDISAPGSFSAEASKDGNTAFHSLGVELDFSSSPAFFDSTFGSAFSRTSTTGHRASAESIFFFTVDTPAEYLIDGFFSVDDAAGTTIPGNVELELELLEFDPGDSSPVALLHSYQVSKSTLDQTFLAGGMDGDDTSLLIGEMMGTLDPSKFYRYRTLVTSNAIDLDGIGATNGSATAMGGHSLIIASAIPEPSSMSLLSLAAAGILLRRRRRLCG